MNTKIDDGGSAFPVMQQYDANFVLMMDAQVGISARDYFAAKAMAALVGDPQLTNLRGMEAVIAVSSYVMADAMLVARRTV